jgi:hypothetical protein
VPALGPTVADVGSEGGPPSLGDALLLRFLGGPAVLAVVSLLLVTGAAIGAWWDITSPELGSFCQSARGRYSAEDRGLRCPSGSRRDLGGAQAATALAAGPAFRSVSGERRPRASRQRIRFVCGEPLHRFVRRRLCLRPARPCLVPVCLLGYPARRPARRRRARLAGLSPR